VIVAAVLVGGGELFERFVVLGPAGLAGFAVGGDGDVVAGRGDDHG